MGRAYEYEARIITGLGKIRIFGQKTIAGMDGLSPGFFGHLNNTVDVEVVFPGSWPHADSLVTLSNVETIFVGLFVDGHRLDA